MRISIRVLAVVATALCLAGCSSGLDGLWNKKPETFTSTIVTHFVTVGSPSRSSGQPRWAPPGELPLPTAADIPVPTQCQFSVSIGGVGMSYIGTFRESVAFRKCLTLQPGLKIVVVETKGAGITPTYSWVVGDETVELF